VVRRLNPDQLLRQYHDYDNAVDCVALLCHVLHNLRVLADRIEQFIWYPVTLNGKGHESTPDFAVILTTGEAIIGEVKSGLGREDDAFDRNAKQLLTYFGCQRVRCKESRREYDVTSAQVLLIVPDAFAEEAVDKLWEAMNDREHGFCPPRMPAVFGYSGTVLYGEEHWVLRRPAQPENGGLPLAEMDSHTRTGTRRIKLPPGKFSRLKTKHRFINDSDTPMLYAVVILLSTVLVERVAAANEWNFTEDEFVSTLKDQYSVRLKSAYLRKVLWTLVELGFIVKFDGRVPTYSLHRKSLGIIRDRGGGRATAKWVARRLPTALPTPGLGEVAYERQELLVDGDPHPAGAEE